MFKSKQEDKGLRAYNVSLLEQGSEKTGVLEEMSELNKETDDASTADDSTLTIHIDTKILNGEHLMKGKKPHHYNLNLICVNLEMKFEMPSQSCMFNYVFIVKNT